MVKEYTFYIKTNSTKASQIHLSIFFVGWGYRKGMGLTVSEVICSVSLIDRGVK